MLEVVFYPTGRANVYELRSEFVVILMDAARRLDLSLIPADLRTPFPEAFGERPGADSDASTTSGMHAPPRDAREAAALVEPRETSDADADTQATVPVTPDGLLEDLMPSAGLKARAGWALEE